MTGSAWIPEQIIAEQRRQVEARWSSGGNAYMPVLDRVGAATSNEARGDAGHDRHPMAEVELRPGIADHPGQRGLAWHQQDRQPVRHATCLEPIGARDAVGAADVIR